MVACEPIRSEMSRTLERAWSTMKDENRLGTWLKLLKSWFDGLRLLGFMLGSSGADANKSTVSIRL